ncbi:MAG TPA: valine--tRNA ligase [bacterium]|nr:valine--tRNA ligase [bacterium]
MSLNRYDPTAIERKWYTYWLDNNLFAPSMGSGQEPFCIVIPPPNVTGSLHMGHAWDNTIQDILIRWARMEGRNALWIPGTDHAGIATQWMVEKALRNRGTTKEEIGREAFLKETWAFKEEAHGTIVGQLKRLGVSTDWNRERFTLDAGLSRAVRRVFVTLFEQGLIYRDLRMVNWSPGLLSAISDLEVEHRETDGHLWHFRYPLADGSGHITVATTRPETMLGDTAVAVHPDDERYRGVVGKTVKLPLVGREIPIVADDFVDPAFGTGAVKVTPGHDPNDFELGKRHDLPVITVMTEDASLNDEVPQAYRGLDRFEARKRVVADMDAAGLLEKVEPHRHALGYCQRSGQVVEPRVSTQWFVKIKPLADKAVAAVEDGRIRMVPDFQKKVFFEWMNNIQDWCISRQLWWGHRIPVWYCDACSAVIASEEDISACTQCGSDKLRMDEDVLDTWFSSGLWPFSTMGWPDDTEDLRTFYPTAVLVTGYDILFFWVARMAMLGLWFMGKEPFHEVFLHGLLRDQYGEKMSKTKGNGLDPLEMIDKYGADALRFTLAAGTVPGRDMNLPEATIEGNRNFINKIWNATRFVQGHTERLGPPPALGGVQPGRFDRWIVARLYQVAGEVRTYLDQRRLNEAYRSLYGFVWHEFCDWYVEITKPALGGEQGPQAEQAALATLHHVLAESLKLLHPAMPFVTEELWSELPGREGSIMVQPFPRPEHLPALGGAWAQDQQAAVREAQQLIDVIQTVRTVRGESNVKPRQRIDVTVVPEDGTLRGLVESEQPTVVTLAGIGELAFAERFAEREGYGHGVGHGFEVYLSLAGLIDVEAERQRIGKELEKTEARIRQLAGKLENPAFVDKAPAAVVEKSREELSALQSQLAKLNESLTQLPAN